MSDNFISSLESLSKLQLIHLITRICDEDKSIQEKIIAMCAKTGGLANEAQERKFENPTINIHNAANSAINRTINCEPVQNQNIISRRSSSAEKIALFKSLFKGRTDVFAQRWQNKMGKSGYSPVCKNKFVYGKCNLKTGCKNCAFKEYAHLDDTFIFNHLKGDDAKGCDVIGVYAILPDSTCNFLVMDFDGANFKKDASVVISVCKRIGIPYSVEISRSGEGMHIWFFFSEAIKAKVARNFGFVILKAASLNAFDFSLSSFDRMIPNQDFVPSGGFGNLVALPLQGQAVKKNASVFVDDDFISYKDQWIYLSSVVKINLAELEVYAENIRSKFNIVLDSEKAVVVEEVPKANVLSEQRIKIEISDGIHILREGLSDATLSTLRHIAVFKNPEYYARQKMRLPVYNIPRFIDCADKNDTELILPRGCLEEIIVCCKESDCELEIEDKTQGGEAIAVSFYGELTDLQSEAVTALLEHKTGVLSAGTGFGKTVIACNIISHLQKNTLIFVHRVNLLQQWKMVVKEFLHIDAGTVGGGVDKRTGQVDIALIQSIKPDENETMPDFLSQYGCAIVDECHHVSAFMFEKVMKAVTAEYVYGLTATPYRRDGHEKIIFMQCGPIRYKTDQKKLALSHGFSHYLVPKFMPYSSPELENKDGKINDCFNFIVMNEKRNEKICLDVKAVLEEERTPLVLSERIEHLKLLKEKLAGMAQHIVLISGKGTVKQKRETLEMLNAVPQNESLVILATGKYVGEGFDHPRVDSLFLTMPVSWKGVLNQYVGRLHRKDENKKEVRIYDYVDFKMPLLEKMYHKRLKEYKNLGYEIKSHENETASNYLYSIDEYKTPFENDLLSAEKHILISSPYLSKNGILSLISLVASRQIDSEKITILTREIEDESAFSVVQRKVLCELVNYGIDVKKIPHLNQRLAVIDSRIFWYASFNFLGIPKEDDCAMRIEDALLSRDILEEL